MPEAKDDLKREKVRIVPISNIEDFPDHPFQVKDDESMAQLVESIRMNGVLNPVIALKIDENHYQLISGHRRKHACILLGIDRIPLIGREMTKEEAVIEMVDSNLQREHILPSEKAKAYKMKYEALKRKAGRPSKDNCTPSEHNFEGKRTVEIIGDENGESKEQIRRFIRLNELTPELLEFVDEGKIGMRPAVELSYLQEEEMRDLVDFIDNEEVFPSHAQTIRMRALSKDGKLDREAIDTIMNEEKPNQKARIKIPMEKIEKYFPAGTSEQKIEETIIKALAMYRQRQKENRDAR
jgi:ParB-like chromosome segregation protein Spo0J